MHFINIILATIVADIFKAFSESSRQYSIPAEAKVLEVDAACEGGRKWFGVFFFCPDSGAGAGKQTCNSI